ncbi:hypothetical protein [Streptomyces sp. NPDC059076]|uniref:hypothetical protein n=1 Tax=unclassified Streptomyces TaxID=2593676 RepID=UPI0036BFBA7E
MEPTASPRTTESPGIGRRHDLETEAGRHLSLIAAPRRTTAVPSPPRAFRFTIGGPLVAADGGEGVEAVAELTTGG